MNPVDYVDFLKWLGFALMVTGLVCLVTLVILVRGFVDDVERRKQAVEDEVSGEYDWYGDPNNQWKW
jgi:hypothetical protein